MRIEAIQLGFPAFDKQPNPPAIPILSPVGERHHLSLSQIKAPLAEVIQHCIIPFIPNYALMQALPPGDLLVCRFQDDQPEFHQLDHKTWQVSDSPINSQPCVGLIMILETDTWQDMRPKIESCLALVGAEGALFIVERGIQGMEETRQLRIQWLKRLGLVEVDIGQRTTKWSDHNEPVLIWRGRRRKEITLAAIIKRHPWVRNKIDRLVEQHQQLGWAKVNLKPLLDQLAQTGNIHQFLDCLERGALIQLEATCGCQIIISADGDPEFAHCCSEEHHSFWPEARPEVDLNHYALLSEFVLGLTIPRERLNFNVFGLGVKQNTLGDFYIGGCGCLHRVVEVTTRGGQPLKAGVIVAVKKKPKCPEHYIWIEGELENMAK